MTTGGGDMYKATQPNLGSPENFTYLLYKPPPNLQVLSKTSFDFFIVYNVSYKTQNVLLYRCCVAVAKAKCLRKDDMSRAVAFSTLVLKPSFSQSFFPHSYLYISYVDLLKVDHSVFGSHWQW